MFHDTSEVEEAWASAGTGPAENEKIGAFGFGNGQQRGARVALTDDSADIGSYFSCRRRPRPRQGLLAFGQQPIMSLWRKLRIGRAEAVDRKHLGSKTDRKLRSPQESVSCDARAIDTYRDA